VDLAHVSKKTMIDVLSVTRAPVIFSHSSAYSLCNASRNVQDDVLKMVVSLILFFLNIIYVCSRSGLETRT